MANLYPKSGILKEKFLSKNIQFIYRIDIQ